MTIIDLIKENKVVVGGFVALIIAYFVLSTGFIPQLATSLSGINGILRIVNKQDVYESGSTLNYNVEVVNNRDTGLYEYYVEVGIVPESWMDDWFGSQYTPLSIVYPKSQVYDPQYPCHQVFKVDIPAGDTLRIDAGTLIIPSENYCPNGWLGDGTYTVYLYLYDEPYPDTTYGNLIDYENVEVRVLEGECTLAKQEECNELSGWECNGDLKEYRSYSCDQNNGECTYTVTQTRVCRLGCDDTRDQCVEEFDPCRGQNPDDGDPCTIDTMRASGEQCLIENTLISCSTGKECVDGVCVSTDLCRDVVCPDGYTCDNGNCVKVNECVGVDCPEGQVCVSGQCVEDDMPLALIFTFLILSAILIPFFIYVTDTHKDIIAWFRKYI